MSRRLGEHTIVIGSSIAGLIAARMLSDHFDRVTILEHGQGMSSAALQAETLQRALGERVGQRTPLGGPAGAFFIKAADVIETPWLLATSSDFAYPQTKGERPPDLDEKGKYLAAVEALSADDPELATLVWEVFSLAKPLAMLWEEPLRSRVLRRMRMS